MTICRQEKLKKEVMVPPKTSPAFEQSRAFYEQLMKEGGILNSNEALEMEIQKDFISSATALVAPLIQIGKRNKVSSFLAANLGWKRFLWQSVREGTNAGLIREQLIERSNIAGDMIRMVALEKNIPVIREMWTKLSTMAEGVEVSKLQEILHDQIVVGNFQRLKNISDSPIMRERLRQRYLQHIQNLEDIGLDNHAQEALEKLSVRISDTFDEMRYIAGQAGMDIKKLENGGYFPIQTTDELGKIWSDNNERWLNGFKSLEETFQKERKTGLPVVVGEDEIASLLQKQLLGKDIDEASQVILTKAEKEKAAKSAKELINKTKELEKDALIKLEGDIEAADKIRKKQLKKDIKDASDLQDAKIKGKTETLEKELRAEGYSASDSKAIVERERQRLLLEKEDILDEINVKSEQKFQEKIDSLNNASKKKLAEKVKSAKNKVTKETAQVLEHEQAKIALREISSNPGELSKFLNANFTPEKMKRLFDAGVLQQMPVMSDELLEFYRGLDLGVRGLADAIVLNPEQAIKQYSEGLAKSVEEQNLFRTAFDLGKDAGWVKAVVSPEEAGDYIKVGSSQRLAKWTGAKNADIGELFIHKDVADQLDSLMKLNTSPKELQAISTAWGMVTSFMKKSMLLGRNVGYMGGVFLQNVISTFASTGSLSQLPMAIADTARYLNGGWEFGSKTKVFTIGESKYSVSELFREVQLRRGGATLDSLHDTADIINPAARSWKRESAERAKHFNSIYGRKWYDPVVGSAKFAGDKFNQAYGALAFWNVALDNAFRWTAVRELAASGKFDNLDDLLKETDNYFAINADSGRLGNLTGQIYMPFAQFAVNAPGAAVRHAINHPWRTANVMQLYATAGQTELTEAELPEWLRTSGDYFATVYKDKDTGSYGVIMPQNVDFMLGSYEWFVDLARDLSGNPRGVTNSIARQRKQDGIFQKLVGDIVDKSYIGNAIMAAMGFDPRSKRKFNDDAPDDTLLGIPMKRATRVLLTELAPILRAVDRALPKEIVGQAPDRETNIFGVNEAVNPGTPSIFGATPTSGGSRDIKGGALGQALMYVTGLTVQEIDPQREIVRTYSDFNRQLGEVKTIRNRLLRETALTGADHKRQIEHLDSAAMSLWLYKEAVDALADERGLSRPSAVEAIRNKRNSTLNEILGTKYRTELQIMEAFTEQWNSQ